MQHRHRSKRSAPCARKVGVRVQVFKSTGKSVEKSTEKSTEKSVEKSVEKSTGKSVEISTANSTDTSTARPQIAPEHFLVPWDCAGDYAREWPLPPMDALDTAWSQVPAMHDSPRIHMLELYARALPPSRRGPPETIPAPPPVASAAVWGMVEGFWN